MSQGRVKNSPVSGAPREKTFRVNYYSNEENRRFQGSFTVKRPTIMQSMQIEGIKSTILEGKYFDPRNPGCGVSPGMATMAEMMAFLKVAVIQAPDWWEGGDGDFSDPTLLFEIYKEAQEVDPFRERIEMLADGDEGKDTEEVLGTDREAGDDQRGRADDDGGLAEMVHPEVQAPDHQQ